MNPRSPRASLARASYRCQSRPPRFVEPCVADLERCLNDVPQAPPPLIKQGPLPYLSLYFKTHRARHFEVLSHVRRASFPN